MHSKRIMVVDDDSSVCETLYEIIASGTRHAVERYTDPIQALDHLKQAPCHLVLTDIVMPKIDGLALAREVKASCPQTEVIVLTGYPSAENAVGALQSRACQFLAKPFTAPCVLEAIETALKRQEAAERLTRNAELSANENVELKRRARHQMGLVSSLERAGTARVVSRMLGQKLRSRIDELKDECAWLTRTMDTGANPETKDRTRRMQDAVQALQAEIEELRSGCPTTSYLHMQPVDVIDLVTSRAREFVEVFPDATLEVTVPREPVKLEIDAEAMGVALLNVLVNAAQATGGVGRVRVSITPQVGVIEITIIDSGIGFSTVSLARALQPFYTTKGPPFVGLGLTLARQIVEDHRGALSIDNAPEGGGRVTIRLQRWRY
jgi:signal transduction histidine kinase